MSDLVADLDALLPALPEAVSSAHLGDEARRVATSFTDADRQIGRLKALADTAALLHASDDNAARTALIRTFDAAEEAGTSMAEAENATGLRTAAEEYKTFVQSLNGVDLALRSLWRILVERHFRALDSVGTIFNHLPGASELGIRMQKTGKEAIASVEANRPAEEHASMVRRLMDERTALLNEQKELAGDPEVDAFLQALTSHRATLDLLTPIVIDWLRKQNALSALKVTSA